MSQLLTLDPRFPVPDSLSLSDSSHPLNLVKQLRETQEQAAVDKEFDPPLPKRLPRKEAFQARQQNAAFLILIALVLAGFYTCTGTLTSVLQILLIFVGIVGLFQVSQML